VGGAVAARTTERAGARRRSRPRGFLHALPWIAPAIAVLAVVFGYGTYRLLMEATHRKGRGVGLDNIRIVFDDPLFRKAVGHNLRLLGALPLLVGVALLVAILLNESLRGWRFHRFSIFLPYVLPIPVIGVIFAQILTLNGVLNQSLHALGLDGLAQDWLGQPRWALWAVGGVIVWKELGFGVVLFLARLLSLPADVFEAARVDGAGFWRLHTRITIPLLGPIIAFYVVIEAITLVSWVFNYVYTLTRGGPADATQVAETYIYSTATTFNAPFLAASAASVLLVGVFGMMIAFSIVRSRVLKDDA
jgi:ABC-type sugar transport system permease subunit